jgi:hypothetical protein
MVTAHAFIEKIRDRELAELEDYWRLCPLDE